MGSRGAMKKCWFIFSFFSLRYSCAILSFVFSLTHNNRSISVLHVNVCSCSLVFVSLSSLSVNVINVSILNCDTFAVFIELFPRVERPWNFFGSALTIHHMIAHILFT